MANRQYSDEDKASALAALDANAGNAARTARDLQIPRSTLQGWARQRGVNHAVPKLRHQKKDDLAIALEELAYRLVSVAPDKVGEATLQQIMTSAGIAIDKMQLLRQQPTSIEQKQPGVTIYLPDNERNSD